MGAASAVVVVEAGIFWEVLVPMLVANGAFGDIVESLTFWEVLVVMSVAFVPVAAFSNSFLVVDVRHIEAANPARISLPQRARKVTSPWQP